MREIKFRMWNKSSSSRFFYDTDGVMECLKQQIIFNEKPSNRLGFNHIGVGCYFEQFTGLQDKNGVDIYEGDIVNVKDGFVGDKRQIVYDNIKCSFMYKILDAVENSMGVKLKGELRSINQYSICNDIEIISNIHEESK